MSRLSMPLIHEDIASITLPDPLHGRVISVDPGVKHTGIATWKDGKFLGSYTVESIDIYMVTAPVSSAELIWRAVTDFGADLILLEDYGYGGRFFNSAQPELIGSLKTRFLDVRSLFSGMVFVAPNTVKKLVVGKGRATKGYVKKAVKKLGFTPQDSHSADAIAVFCAYCKLWEKPSPAMISRSIISSWM